MKMKTQHTDPMGYSKGKAKGKVIYEHIHFFKNPEISQIKRKMMHFQILKSKSKITRW
jgi:hypothetical protein